MPNIWQTPISSAPDSKPAATQGGGTSILPGLQAGEDVNASVERIFSGRTPLLDKLAHSLLRAQTDSEFDALQGAAGQPDAADHDPEDAP
ncbi:hypothetical protein [Xanthomonas euvesicatoria]|uniref:hypothetical protein n=1 Tax=Xanthomonas euvesicatoria TaxID=456327 RepID=UPI001C4820BE|nr:hypothetical protein [Xanthomonas euvesicatoria]MBV6872208.1 hypothetical protein [Xanthomonas campestris pv. veroniae]